MTPNRPPTLPRALRVTVADLEAIAYVASYLAKHLPDVHVLAYEQQVTSDDPAVRTSRTDWALDEVGQARAKEALRRLTAERTPYGARAVLVALMAHKAAIDALFAGEGADVTLRGTLLGDESGNGAQRELTEALRARDRRAARGEYTPVVTEPQSKRVPGA